ncbi:MAG: thiamine-phosphate kinase [Chloroflexi bacterium]|nr:thiamine-phosphate kinase [Chloroflexota bacterium]|tara:strand:+ start:529 stop:1557 length:1029 start_codon:yes stop_codon:yes gene_type:complete
MEIQELGEFGVIDLLTRMVVQQRGGPNHGADLSFKLTVDNGDDTAAWQTGKATELFTTDTVVEGVHFTRETTPWRDLGWKCISSNVSDIAAMGGLPMYALVTLGLPPETEVSELEQLYEGMMEISNEHGVAIVGGDMVRSPVVFITIGLTGIHAGQPMLRSTARPGDQVAVTGYLGSSGGGLRLMLGAGHDSNLSDQVSEEAAEYLRVCHRRPRPAVAEGRILSASGVVTAMDVSDGLADDLSKLCRSSGLSARIHAGQVPVHPLLKQAYPDDYLDLALGGGEDYLLLFTAPAEVMALVMPQLSQGAAVVGELLPGEPGRVSVLDVDGSERPASGAGWDHFR